MSEDPILSAIAKLGSDLRTEIAALGDNLRGDLALLGTELRAEITQLDTNLRGEIAQTRAETAKLIEGVQTSVDSIRDDLTVLGGENDRLRRLNENTRDEGRDISRVREEPFAIPHA